jgi:hypothetical protein
VAGQDARKLDLGPGSCGVTPLGACDSGTAPRGAANGVR